jgi:hypothetical protein
MVPRVIYMVNDDLYWRLNELGIDQPKGKAQVDETGRVLPDGNPITAAPSLNRVDLAPNPLLRLRDRVRDGVLLPTGPMGLPSASSSWVNGADWNGKKNYEDASSNVRP